MAGGRRRVTLAGAPPDVERRTAPYKFAAAISDGNNKLTSLAPANERAHRANKECVASTNKKTHRKALAPSAGEAAPLAAALLVYVRPLGARSLDTIIIMKAARGFARCEY